MRNILLMSVSVIGMSLALSSCNKVVNPNWSNDCEKYSSIDPREYSQCLARNKAAEPAPASNPCNHNHVPKQDTGVRIDPADMSRLPAHDLGKGH